MGFWKVREQRPPHIHSVPPARACLVDDQLWFETHRLLFLPCAPVTLQLATTGLGARCVMIGTLTAGQFGIFDIVMNAVGASKFHFHPPGEKH